MSRSNNWPQKPLYLPLTLGAMFTLFMVGCGDLPQEGSMVTALKGNCTVTLAGSPTAGSVSAGTTVNFTATGSCTTGTPEYLYSVKEPTGHWSTLRTWGANTLAWDTSYVFSGVHSIYVKVRAQGSGDTWEGYSTTLNYTITGGRLFCTAGTVTPSPATTATAGTTVTLTGSGTCPAGSPAEYKFMLKDPAGQWRLLRNFSTTATYNWDTTGWLDGSYTLYSFIRRRFSAAYAGYEVVASGAYTLTGGSAFCGTATISATPSGNITAGTSVTFTAGSTCTSGATAQYRFTDLLPTGFYRTLQNWGTSNTYAWSTSSSTLNGNHQIFVDVRRVGSTQAFEDRSSKLFTGVTGGADFCSNASFSASPASPTAAGTTVNFTGTATCPGSGTPEYRYVRKGPDGLWRTAQNWSSSANFAWSTTGAQTGTHSFYFYVRLQGSAQAFEDAAGPTNHAITGGDGYCGTATLGVSPASPQTVGASLTLTAGATCTSGSAEYRYLSRQPDGQFRLLTEWTSSTTYVWDTTGADTGTWTLFVYSRRQGSTASAEGVSSNVSYVLN